MAKWSETIREAFDLFAALLAAAWSGMFFLVGWLSGAAIAASRAGWKTGRGTTRAEEMPSVPWVTDVDDRD